MQSIYYTILHLKNVCLEIHMESNHQGIDIIVVDDMYLLDGWANSSRSSQMFPIDTTVEMAVLICRKIGLTPENGRFSTRKMMITHWM